MDVLQLPNLQRLKAHLQFEEACNLDVHTVQGLPHIGWGRSLTTKGLSDEELDHLGYEDEDDIEHITQDQADYLLQNDIEDAIDDAYEVVGEPFWSEMSELRREVIISIAYNAGKLGLSKFRRMLKALRSADYAEAAKQILDSNAAKYQAPNRYKRLATTMASNDVSDLELPDWTEQTEQTEQIQLNLDLSQITNTELINELKRRLDS